ncbi:hypothetical protein OD218_005123 [Salmonella enterica]|uniref:hypothetical protein n=1 Tax=Salmonella enterica TaxID=28901 RepID=UPI000AD32862|nr:hypothetical protein [Salmonella enterica]EHL1810690.1 hypothetical protein [Salmonella enterica subsp. diarizonae]EHN1751575.1 hypothetical protein [Salmonella enterica subsp. diarizonae serovar 50:z52:z35]EEN6471019.1 hypothetical protein [Salmonella enterica subsp. enterica]EFO7858619.1 hypothetical protein [Salmonella enterica]EGC4950696.1 hypothetical protein [Salmonella enterica]
MLSPDRHADSASGRQFSSASATRIPDGDEVQALREQLKQMEQAIKTVKVEVLNAL